MTARTNNGFAALPDQHDPPADHDWREAGAAWGHRAVDWACLFEHYAAAAVGIIHRETEVSHGTELLDVACGSGLALTRAADAGAVPHGLDAAAELIGIARDRLPLADLRVGSMFELPWPEESFDVVTSINGVWGGCDQAVVEAYRVLRRGGRIGLSFWGTGPPLDLRPVFKVFARHAPDPHYRGMKRLNDIAHVGVAESMLEAAGFRDIERRSCVSVVEWPDAHTAWRALSSLGPAVPALLRSGTARVNVDVLEAIEPCRDDRGMYRFRNDHQMVFARR